MGTTNLGYFLDVGRKTYLNDVISFVIHFFYILSWVVIKNIFTAEKISSLIAVFGLANIPLIKFSVIWWNTLHQPASIKFFRGKAQYMKVCLLH